MKLVLKLFLVGLIILVTAIIVNFIAMGLNITTWYDFIENAKSNLVASNKTQDSKKDEDVEKLYDKIGKLQMEVDYLKKKLL